MRCTAETIVYIKITTFLIIRPVLIFPLWSYDTFIKRREKIILLNDFFNASYSELALHYGVNMVVQNNVNLH